MVLIVKRDIFVILACVLLAVLFSSLVFAAASSKKAQDLGSSSLKNGKDVKADVKSSGANPVTKPIVPALLVKKEGVKSDVLTPDLGRVKSVECSADTDCGPVQDCGYTWQCVVGSCEKVSLACTRPVVQDVAKVAVGMVGSEIPLPKSVQKIFGNERINLYLDGDTTPAYGVVMKDNVLVDAQSGGVSQETLRVFTSEEVLVSLFNAKLDFETALGKKLIRYKGAGFVSGIKFRVVKFFQGFFITSPVVHDDVGSTPAANNDSSVESPGSVASDESEGSSCYSAGAGPEGLCPRRQACADSACGPVADCVDGANTITVTLENGNAQTYTHGNGARYFCAERDGQKSVDYRFPCSSPYHQSGGIGGMNYQCPFDRATGALQYCAQGSCGAIASCTQNGDTATITLTNGESQSYPWYACVSNTEISAISSCETPFEQQGSYCSTGRFCADRVCGTIASCEETDGDTIHVTLTSGQEETYDGNYACVRSNGTLSIRTRSSCTSPFGQSAGFCGSQYRDSRYENQFCAGNICDFMASCVQTDADSVMITTENGRTASYDRYTCDAERGVRSTEASTFSCYSPNSEQETNSDGLVVDSTLCRRGEACAGATGRCGNLANCVDNETSITVTLADGSTQTYNHSQGAQYFCREDVSGEISIEYAFPCSSPYHQSGGGGGMNYQCPFNRATGALQYCARGSCGAIASCTQSGDTATITLANRETQSYQWYHCNIGEDGTTSLTRN